MSDFAKLKEKLHEMGSSDLLLLYQMVCNELGKRKLTLKEYIDARMETRSEQTPKDLPELLDQQER